MVTIKKQFKKIVMAIIFGALFIGQISLAHAAISTSDLVSMVNDSRLQANLQTLTISSQLESAAKAKADDMFKNQYFNHISPSNKTPWDFIKAANYTYVYAGENLAIGYDDSTELHNAWMNSPSHRENIMNPNFREIGIAKVSGTYEGASTIIVVQMFGSQNAATPVSTEKVAGKTTTAHPITFEIVKDKTTFLPDKIFVGDEVTFKATITGESQEVYFTVGERKISLDQTLEKKVFINQDGDLKVTLTASDAYGNQDAKEIGTLRVAKKVIVNASTKSSTGIGAPFLNTVSVLKNNLMIVSLIMITLTLALAGYFLFRQKKYGKFI